MPRLPTVAAVGLVVLVVLAGCTGAGGDGAAVSGGSDGGDRSLTTGSDGGAEQVDDDGPTDASQRRVIRTGHVVLDVEDFDQSRRNLTEAVQQRGGYVSDSTQQRNSVGEETYLTGSVTLRVPQDDFKAMMERVESEGTVETSRTNTNDVTEQLVDIEARLENLRAERDRLRELYERANETEEILQVQERLSDVQGEIERLEAQKQSLERRVAYSTITVELREPRPDYTPGPTDQWYDVPIVDAFFESVHGVGVTLRAIVVLLAYAAPYVVAFAAPPVVLGGALLAWRRGHFAR